MKIAKCPFGGGVKWSNIWEPLPEYEYIALECTKSRCNHGDWDCRSEYFFNNEKGRIAAVIDWNRKIKKKKSEVKK